MRHLVPLGSPIDKLHYYFESRRTPHHRYVGVSDDVRGDIGEVPFAKNRKRHIHWVNIWDRADILSGPLHSPTNGRTPKLKVDNLEVSSLPFPSPGASHDAYFHSPEVVGHLFRIVFDGGCDYLEAPRNERGSPEYAALDLGPGRGRRSTRWIQLAALTVPWSVLILIVLALVGALETAWGPVLGVLGGTAVLFAIGTALNQRRRRTLL